ncbi:MAG TPA: hypothetical protein VNL35_09975 [Chloroflexota bacterium]|nr:hypothetical protein [Chloroflexota bacterium]
MTAPNAEAPEAKPSVSSVAREAKDLLLKLQDDILDILTSRFGTVPPGTPDQVSRLTDLASLRSLVIEAATTDSLESFSRSLKHYEAV